MVVQQGNQLIQVPNQPGVIIRPQSIEALNPEGGGKGTVYYIPVQLPSENGAVFHGGSHMLVSNGGVPPTHESANLLVTPLRENMPSLLVTPRPDDPSPSHKSDSPMLVTPLPGTTTSSYPDPRKMRSSTQEDKARSVDFQEDLESGNEDGDSSERGGQWMSRVSFNMGVSSPSGPVRRRHHNNPGKT